MTRVVQVEQSHLTGRKGTTQTGVTLAKALGKTEINILTRFMNLKRDIHAPRDHVDDIMLVNSRKRIRRRSCSA